MSLSGVIEKDKTHEHSSFTWTIKNFTQKRDTNALSHKSPCFVTFNGSKNVWFLHLSQNRSSDGLAVTLHLQSKEKPLSTVEVEIIIKHLKTVFINTKKFEAGDENITIPFSELAYHRHLYGNNVDGIETDLIIHCRMKFILDQMEMSEHCKNNDLKLFLQSESLSDITLVVGETKFPVHKAILASRSPVFLAMFDHQMEEIIKNEVIITDDNEETIKVLILYIYTDEVENLDDNTVDILIAAKKYELKELVNICGISLSNRIDLENVLEYLLLAVLYNIYNLKKNCLKFISANLNEVLQVPTFDSFRKENPQLVYEILTAAAERESLLHKKKNRLVEM